MNKIAGLFGIVAILVAFGAVGTGDLQVAQANRSSYCEMVAIWDADAARGVPPAQRNGWPPYEGRCDD